jgi:hypothetical protein
MRIGLHARNDVQWPNRDYEAMQRAKIESLVTMSFTSTETYARIMAQTDGKMDIVVRLFDDRLRNRNIVTPQQFAGKMLPLINRARPYAKKFQIHNEPNHASGLEGWGATDADAESFNSWYQIVYPILKDAAPWATFGFPGLAVNWPHRDAEWLDICQPSIEISDWLGAHCYWQYENMMSPDWGLRYKVYHQKYPLKTIEVTEFGDSTPGLNADEIARRYVEYYQHLQREPYLMSASAFIASSPDPQWASFAWVKESGEILPVVDAVGAMPRMGVNVPHIVNIVRKLRNNPNPREPYGKRSLDEITRLVVHHSAVPPHVGARRINEYHISYWDWERIGYHFIIKADGTILQTNELSTVSNHAFGANANGVGICLLGSFMPYADKRPTQAQIESLRQLCDYLRTVLNLGPEAIVGHKEVRRSSTACPGTSWAWVKKQII